MLASLGHEELRKDKKFIKKYLVHFNAYLCSKKNIVNYGFCDKIC